MKQPFQPTSRFPRRKNDFYATWDTRATPPLLPHLHPATRFIEPCAGAGDLTAQLRAAGHVCTEQTDINPQAPDIEQADAATRQYDVSNGEIFITNPPWTRQILQPMLLNWLKQAPVWILIDAGFPYNKRTDERIKNCLARQVPVGRLKWIRNSPHDSSKNTVWCYLTSEWNKPYSEFYPWREK